MSEKEPANLLDWLYDLRDQQRARKAKSAWLLKAKDIPWEQNSQGKMKWYLHPALESVCDHSMISFVQEIPPGGRSGSQATPGGMVLYILQGRGYTLIDGVRHDWEADDCVNIPIRRDGVVVQHFNLDATQPVQFLSVEPNLVHTLGVDRGAVFEQRAPASE